MQSHEFIQLGQQIAGVGHGYQKLLAEKLGVGTDSIKKYASGNRLVPKSIELLMKELIDKKHG